MIIYRTWRKLEHAHGALKYEYEFEGWFLFGFVPLYIKRNIIKVYH